MQYFNVHDQSYVFDALCARSWTLKSVLTMPLFPVLGPAWTHLNSLRPLAYFISRIQQLFSVRVVILSPILKARGSFEPRFPSCV